MPEPVADPAERRVGFRELARYFVGLGTWGFGGPIATVGYMQRDLVERRGWLDRQDFLNGVALGQTMPGPLAAQVVMWVGYLQRGPLGALVTALTFILPSFVLVLAVAFHTHTPIHPHTHTPIHRFVGASRCGCPASGAAPTS
jgi:chromate transporter